MLIDHPPLDSDQPLLLLHLPGQGWPAPSPKTPPRVLLHQLRDCLRRVRRQTMTDPEDDLRCLVDNERKLELSGYYYGSLSWLDASRLLRRCKVGTFLIRDSEHGSYLYTLSVQTRKGPTSCRIEYSDCSFRLDCARDLWHKMPRFDCVPQLVDFYVRLLPHRKSGGKAVWLDMDEENTLDVPVQIYRPLYRQVRSLQHLCRLNIARQAGAPPASCKPRTLQADRDLPNIMKEYLRQYPYSQ